jgi:hypothetical protein
MNPCVRFGEASAAVQHQKGAGIVRIKPVFEQNRLSYQGLHRDESERRTRLMAFQESSTSRAKTANAVKDDDPRIPLRL